MFSKKWKFTLNGNKGTAGADAVSAMQQMVAVWLTDYEAKLEDKLKLAAGLKSMLETAGRKKVAATLNLNDFVVMPTDQVVLVLAEALGFSSNESEPACEHESPEVFLLMEMLGLDALVGHRAIEVRVRKSKRKWSWTTNRDGNIGVRSLGRGIDPALTAPIERLDLRGAPTPGELH